MLHTWTFRSFLVVILACAFSAGDVHGQLGGRARIDRVEYLWDPNFLSIRVHFNSGSNSKAVYGVASLALIDRFSGERVIVNAPRDQVEVPGLAGVFAFTLGNVGIVPPYEFMVSLWDRLVDISECHAGPGGGPDEYCLKNGFHLEGRLDSRGWIRVEPWITPGRWQSR